MASSTQPMPTNEEGEFELILGNKQLLSVFFIVIILLGVFFTIGYIIGRNSTPLTTSAARNVTTDPAERRTTPAPSPVGEAKPKDEPPQSVPVQTNTAPSAAESEAARTAPSKPADQPMEIPAVAATGVQNPQPGMLYVQVLAVPRAEAEVLSGVLAKKGMRTVVAPGPDERLFRVLVGPVKDAAEAAKVKIDLEQAGFKGAFPKRY